LEDEFLRFVNESKSLEKIMGALYATFIALIPKNTKLESFEEYRPISQCNYVYNIIAKIMASKLKVLSRFISEEKFRFLFNKGSCKGNKSLPSAN
jgi:hypothetical protein